MTTQRAQTRRMLTTADVADELATTAAKVRQMIRRRELPAVNIATSGRPDYRIARAALDQYLSDHAVAS
jgi:excisionase family DNA binding protein